MKRLLIGLMLGSFSIMLRADTLEQLPDLENMNQLPLGEICLVQTEQNMTDRGLRYFIEIEPQKFKTVASITCLNFIGKKSLVTLDTKISNQKSENAHIQDTQRKAINLMTDELDFTLQHCGSGKNMIAFSECSFIKN